MRPCTPETLLRRLTPALLVILTGLAGTPRGAADTPDPEPQDDHNSRGIVFHNITWSLIDLLDARPGQNDSDEELTQIAEFLASVSPDLPWHISRFHPDYKMTHIPATPIQTLHRAAESGQAAGRRYVYVGNVWGGES